jgi:hypothetical protein
VKPALKPEFALARQIPGTSQLERVRAAREILNSRLDSERNRMAAFLAIFHPEKDIERCLRVAGCADGEGE